MISLWCTVIRNWRCNPVNLVFWKRFSRFCFSSIRGPDQGQLDKRHQKKLGKKRNRFANLWNVKCFSNFRLISMPNRQGFAAAKFWLRCQVDRSMAKNLVDSDDGWHEIWPAAFHVLLHLWKLRPAKISALPSQHNNWVVFEDKKSEKASQ